MGRSGAMGGQVLEGTGALLARFRVRVVLHPSPSSSEPVDGREGRTRLVGWLLLGAAGLGGLAAISVQLAAGLVLIVLVGALFARSPHKPELVIGLYWLAFCVYETIFSGLTIPGFFYPFYAAFAVSLVAISIASGVRVRISFFWLYVAFLGVVALSFVGFAEPIDFAVIQRVLAYLIGLLVYLQFRSREGVGLVAGAAAVSSLALAVWVIVSAVEGGFVYRGDVGVNENVVSFYVGLGFVVTFCATLQALGSKQRRYIGLFLLLLTGVMGYALLLLASRGMAIAAAVALLSVVLRLAVQDRRKLLPVLAILAVAAAGMLLPGGEGLVQRFTGERVESGGSRTPIWHAVYDAYRGGNIQELVVGNGFGSSSTVVQQGFGTLTSTHNAFLEVLYEFGALGLTLFLALHVAALVVAWRTAGVLGLIMFATTAFLLVADTTSTAPDGFLYWTALALVLACGTWGRAGEGAGALRLPGITHPPAAEPHGAEP